LKLRSIRLLIIFLICGDLAIGQNKMIVFQSDFGLKDGAVAVMKGVALGVSDDLKLFDLTHEIPPFNIWEAAVRLQQTVPWWPEGTVFVSVVDPGVGTDRAPVVAKTKTGQYIVTPDNGTLTLIAENPGIVSVRKINELTNRLQGSRGSYTFEGRDVFAYTAARLASGVISYEEVGAIKLLPAQKLAYREAEYADRKLKGIVYILDREYGNVWTNITEKLFRRLGPHYGDLVILKVSREGRVVFEGEMPYCKTFGDVEAGLPLAYINSLEQLSFALNRGDFAGTHGIESGVEWEVEVTIREE
jgi:S-adenosylmethionine hydrolase